MHAGCLVNGIAVDEHDLVDIVRHPRSDMRQVAFLVQGWNHHGNGRVLRVVGKPFPNAY
jgi:hypothetical protein